MLDRFPRGSQTRLQLWPGAVECILPHSSDDLESDLAWSRHCRLTHMKLPAFIARALSALTPAPTPGSHPLESSSDSSSHEFSASEWPLPPAIPVLLLAPPTPWPLQYRGDRITYPYPLDMLELIGIVETHPAPEAKRAGDGKYCEFVSARGEVRYFLCREFVDALQGSGNAASLGVKGMRWVALDAFGYDDEAAEVYRSIERDTGSTMAATGLARLLLNRRPGRALALLQDAQRAGTQGAVLLACLARVMFACGQVERGTAAAAAALNGPPEPDWRDADRMYSWGLLHGAALACHIDPSIRADVVTAIRSLIKEDVTAERRRACAALLDVAGSSAPSLSEDPLTFAVSSERGDSDPATVDLSDVDEVRRYCRRIATSANGALVQADVVKTAHGRAIQLIYKTGGRPGFDFTGTHLEPGEEQWRISTVTAGESGTTGEREAVVTAHLMQSGVLDLATYQSSWGRDPYDATYRSTKGIHPKFISDDVVFDRMFPRHPLTRVRRALSTLHQSG